MLLGIKYSYLVGALSKTGTAELRLTASRVASRVKCPLLGPFIPKKEEKSIDSFLLQRIKELIMVHNSLKTH